MRSFEMPRVAVVVVAVLVGVWIAAGPGTVTAQEEPLSVVLEATDAVNAGDMDAWMALWADDGVWDADPCYIFIGPGGCVGKDAISNISSAFVLDNLVWVWTPEPEVSGATVTGPAEFTTGSMAALGIERVLVSRAAFEVVNGKITHFSLDIDASDPDSVAWSDGLYLSAGSQSPLSVTKDGTDAVNAADLNGWMAFWAEDGVFEMDACYAAIGPDGCVGKEAISAVAAVFLADNFSWVWTEGLSVSGVTVSGPSELRVDALAALGIERVKFSNAAFTVVGGKITLAHFDTDLSDPDSALWQAALFASVEVEPPATGNAGLAATNRNGGGPMWPLASGALLMALAVSLWLVSARRWVV